MVSYLTVKGRDEIGSLDSPRPAQATGVSANLQVMGSRVKLLTTIKTQLMSKLLSGILKVCKRRSQSCRNSSKKSGLMLSPFKKQCWKKTKKFSHADLRPSDMTGKKTTKEALSLLCETTFQLWRYSTMTKRIWNTRL
ncbi:hypothetical protein ElyMa_000187100 [Elysia marginata]|uniref:Uncharacterized protein n=1 Tax=Elysia marginata TaxID=1093978 RepID=A0AAV4EV08_9GAST|nr:hypothetical protein ElyMa_000187100 [Elysia marginata]